MSNQTMYRQVYLLTSSQALFQTISIMVMTIGGLAGALLASKPEYATLPIASMFLGTAVMMFPASIFMNKFGRRTGFICGAFLGVIGGVIAASSLYFHSLFLLALGTSFIGAFQAFAQFYRFAASEVANDQFRPKAISWVIAGGVVAALLGPTLANFGGHLFKLEYLGSFMILTIVALLAMAVLFFLKLPHIVSTALNTTTSRSWKIIVTQPTYFVALLVAATGYGIMILGMTATPIAMKYLHYELGEITTVIQLHVLGMFLPSFFTGSLITRFGSIKIILAGIICFVGYIFVGTWSDSFYAFAIALTLLGIGWNFLFITGTTLLTATYTTEEKSKAQAINDMVVFATGLVCSFSTAGLLNYLGWQNMNMLLILWLVTITLVVIWFSLKLKNQICNS